jgi:hypothetical protein
MMVTKASLLLPVLALAPTTLLAHDDERALVGVWRYVGEMDTRSDGSPAPDSALSPTQGLLIYTADGFMAVVHMPEGRKWLTESASPAQLRETVGNGTAYAGRYKVDPVAHTITHMTSVSLEPEFQGRSLTRTYSIDGDTLKLSGTFPYHGETISFVITWTRADGAAYATPPPEKSPAGKREG